MLGDASHEIGHTLAHWTGLFHAPDVRSPGAAAVGELPEADADLLQALSQARRDLQVAVAANAAKTDMLSRVSHEMRTPLHALIGFTQLLEADGRGNPLDDAQQRRLAQIRQAGEYLLMMVGDLLDLSLVESGRLQVRVEPVALAPLAAECLDLVRGQAEAACVHLRPGDVPHALWVRADPTRLKQVLINLLTNGIKYNRPGGEVRLAARLGPEGHCLVEVHDTGLGIPADHHQHLFKPFHRLGRESGPVQGSGLGLALSQALATLMGGQIAVHTSTAAGTCLQVKLRRA